jgi:short-subunit dehydrogenase
MRLSGAVVLVTGASSGIGAAIAREMAAAGARLLIAGRNWARLTDLAAETGAIALEADLAVPGGPATLAAAAMRASAALRAQAPLTASAVLRAPAALPASVPRTSVPLPAAAVPRANSALPASPAPAAGRRRGSAMLPARGGGIDLLINNAGCGWRGPLDEMATAKVDELITVNLTAPIQLTRLLIPGMAARRRGRVVFVSSIAGVTGVREEAVYAAAKAGLSCFAESLRHELDGRGVGVSVVVPGVADTPFFDRRGMPYQRKWPAPMPAQRVARAVLTAAERERDVVFVPRWMRLPAWLHGTAPAAFHALARRFG